MTTISLYCWLQLFFIELHFRCPSMGVGGGGAITENAHNYDDYCQNYLPQQSIIYQCALHLITFTSHWYQMLI